MAINPETQYPGKIAPSSTNYPYGAARNITVPGDGTGTPWDAALVNDIFGFQQALLSKAGVVPSGSPDTAQASQYLTALKKIPGLWGPTTFLTTDDLKNGDCITGVAASFSDLASIKAQVFTVFNNSEAVKYGHAYIVKTRADHRLDISDPSWVPDGAKDFYLDGGTTYVAVRKQVSAEAQKERINALITSGELVWSVLGDSTEAGVGAGGGVYAECTEERVNGWANYVAYYMARNDPAFIAPDDRAYRVAQPFRANSNEATNTLALPYPSWQGTKVLDPTIEFFANNAARNTRDKFTVYVNERTSDTAATFQLTVRDGKTDALLFQGTLDTYVPQETYGAAGSFNVSGRMAKRTVTLSAAARYVKITIDSIDTVDRGSGAAADGTAAIYGFTFGEGVEFHNLAVSSTTLQNNSSANQSRGVTTAGRLATAQGFNSNMYVIGFGTNDSKAGVSTPEDFRSEYYQLISDILTGEPDAVIVLSTDPKGLASPYDNNPAFNAVTRDIANEFGFLLMDVEKLSNTLPSGFYADDVHPSGEGVFQITQAFCDLVGVTPVNFVYSRPSSEQNPRAGEFEIAAGTPVPTTLTEVFSEVIPRNDDATFLIVRADIGFVNDTDDRLNVTAELKINGTLFDTKRVGVVDGSGAINFPRLQMSLGKTYQFGSSASYDISIELIDNFGDGTTEIESRAVVHYLWV